MIIKKDYFVTIKLKNIKKKQQTSSKVKTLGWYKTISFAWSRSGDGALGLLECIKCAKVYEFEPLVEGAPPTACPECGYAGEGERSD